jgi:translocator protein
MTSPLPPDQTPLPTDAPATSRQSLLALAGWVALVLGLGVGVGVFFGPDDWFRTLLKPTWNPPNWLFGPVWALLYVLMGVAVWLVRRQPDVPRVVIAQAMRLFWIQLGLNLLWTPIFFGLHQPGLAFVEICLIWIAALYTAIAFGKIRALAGYLLVPYLLWISFALVLNGTIWLMNT